MFTGLIEDNGRVASLVRRSESGIIVIETSLPTSEISIGDSIAVNGACLTVTEKGANRLTFDVSPESLSRTTLGKLNTGSRVNLERALKMGDRLGGHIVTGHIDCSGRLSGSELRSGNHQLQFTIPAEYARYVVEKGSVAIDGISLTVNTVTRDSFSVNIIPLTFAATTLNQLRSGDTVNIETDIIGKYIERLTSPWKAESGLSIKTLAENGFL